MILGNFHRRGYPLELLKTAWNAVKGLNRDLLLVEKPPSTQTPSEDSFYLTTTYNPASPNLKGILTDHWDLMGLPPHNTHINIAQVKQVIGDVPTLRTNCVNPQ